jgi:acyl CoA:acetate/3-ketoacid CoA transferase alpha subunit
VDSEHVGILIKNSVPESLIHELRESKANELTVVSNNAGTEFLDFSYYFRITGLRNRITVGTQISEKNGMFISGLKPSL